MVFHSKRVDEGDDLAVDELLLAVWKVAVGPGGAHRPFAGATYRMERNPPQVTFGGMGKPNLLRGAKSFTVKVWREDGHVVGAVDSLTRKPDVRLFQMPIQGSIDDLAVQVVNLVSAFFVSKLV